MDVHRRFWGAFGALNQALFAVTVVRLFVFLKGGEGFHAWIAPGLRWAWLDSLLAVQFAVLHSAMLWPSIRSRLNQMMPTALGGSFFSAFTCLSLFLTMELWHASPSALWRLDGGGRWVVSGLFFASWAALVYSLWLTGFGYQTGFTTWWAWLRREETPRRAFAPKGAYRFVRHPVYLSFLGLVWFNPEMTTDRLVLALLWTAHIAVGSHLKDRRMERFVGDPYREYEARVPGFPMMVGPLGKKVRRDGSHGASTPPLVRSEATAR